MASVGGAALWWVCVSKGPAISWGMGLVLLMIIAGYVRATGRVAWEKLGAMPILLVLAFVASNVSALVFSGVCVLMLVPSIVVRAGLIRSRKTNPAGQMAGAAESAS